MSWLLNGLYALLLLALSPVLLYRVLVLGKYRAGWAEKILGRLPRRTSDRFCVWLHAVSVGEVLQLQTVVRQLQAAEPDWDIWITTTTHTGHAVAREKFPEHTVGYFPLDFSGTVQTALKRVRPSMIVLVELELWPNFIRAASEAKIPLVLINGRISEKSFRGYRRARFLMKNLLRQFDGLAVQSQTYADRFMALGASPEQITVTGSIKFDGVQPDCGNPQTLALGKSFGLQDDERIFIAGSTQDPEETYALETYQALRKLFPTLRLILVPRHQERFEEVAHLVEERGLPLLRRSVLKRKTMDNGQRTADNPVMLLDTLGELSACWGLAEIAFVGGSLTNRGGQNMIEPSAYGAGVLFGPNTRNFRDVVELLLSHNAARVVANAEELTTCIQNWLANPAEAARWGQRAQALVLAQQGATAKTIQLLRDAAEPQTRHRLEKAA